jgi:hypothetical protein
LKVARGVAEAEGKAALERHRRQIAEADAERLQAHQARQEIGARLEALEALEMRLNEAKMADRPLGVGGGSLVQHPLLKDSLAAVLQDAAILTATPIQTPIRVYHNDPVQAGLSPAPALATTNGPATQSPRSLVALPSLRTSQRTSPNTALA